MWGWGYGGWGNWIGWLGPVFMIAVWALIITGGVFLIRYLVRSGQRRDREESSGEILNRRYARGEISKEEYQEKRKDLDSGR